MQQKTTTHLIPGAIITSTMTVANPQADRRTTAYQQQLDRQVAELMAANSQIRK